MIEGFYTTLLNQVEVGGRRKLRVRENVDLFDNLGRERTVSPEEAQTAKQLYSRIPPGLSHLLEPPS